MSKIINQINAIQTNIIYSIPEPLKLFDFKHEVDYSTMPRACLYKIEVKLGAQTIIPEDSVLNVSNVLTIHQRRIRQQVANEIFGEFQPMLLELREELYNKNFFKCHEVLDKIYDTMFNVE